MANDDVMNLIGTLGGAFISLSLVPQVILTYRTKCTTDISYTYQAIYIVGTALVNTYAIYFGYWAVYGPCLLESTLIITLTVMKIVYDRRNFLKQQQLVEGDGVSYLDSREGGGGTIIQSVKSDMAKAGTSRTAHMNQDVVERNADSPFFNEPLHISFPALISSSSVHSRSRRALTSSIHSFKKRLSMDHSVGQMRRASMDNVLSSSQQISNSNRRASMGGFLSRSFANRTGRNSVANGAISEPTRNAYASLQSIHKSLTKLYRLDVDLISDETVVNEILALTLKVETDLNKIIENVDENRKRKKNVDEMKASTKNESFLRSTERICNKGENHNHTEEYTEDGDRKDDLKADIP